MQICFLSHVFKSSFDHLLPISHSFWWENKNDKSDNLKNFFSLIFSVVMWFMRQHISFISKIFSFFSRVLNSLLSWTNVHNSLSLSCAIFFLNNEFRKKYSNLFHSFIIFTIMRLLIARQERKLLALGQRWSHRSTLWHNSRHFMTWGQIFTPKISVIEKLQPQSANHFCH